MSFNHGRACKHASCSESRCKSKLEPRGVVVAYSLEDPYDFLDYYSDDDGTARWGRAKVNDSDEDTASLERRAASPGCAGISRTCFSCGENAPMGTPSSATTCAPSTNAPTRPPRLSVLPVPSAALAPQARATALIRLLGTARRLPDALASLVHACSAA